MKSVIRLSLGLNFYQEKWWNRFVREHENLPSIPDLFNVEVDCLKLTPIYIDESYT